MPSCFVEEQLTQRRERRVGHVPQSEQLHPSAAAWARQHVEPKRPLEKLRRSRGRDLPFVPRASSSPTASARTKACSYKSLRALTSR
jgi:hypothetical protein